MSGRRLGLALVIGTIVLGALGTQWPFEYRTSAFALHRHWQKIEWAWFPRAHHGRIEIDDLVINLVMLMPLGFGWALWRRGPARRVLVESAVVGALVSTAYEAAQLLTRDRFTQLADVWRNSVSCALGCAAALVLVAVLRRDVSGEREQR